MDSKYLTTSQVAAYFHVTRFTIRNWIKSGKLRAYRTLGGHQRIPKESILSFISKNKTIRKKISPPAPERTTDTIVPCWKSKSATSSGRHYCSSCLVFKERMDRCFFMIKNFGPEKVQCRVDCLECQYLATYYPKERKMLESLQQPKPPVKTHDTPVKPPAKANTSDVMNFFQKGLYVSGKYVGFLKKRK